MCVCCVCVHQLMLHYNTENQVKICSGGGGGGVLGMLVHYDVAQCQY